ncbi:MAG: hypothetical protein M1815_001263 [Lichina confinis]|nr:MAG: hypothetical protein M1815_001263 [Lichina confinis]
MIRLGLVTHPETGHPWLAPIDALNDARDVAGHGDADASENPESGGSGDPKSKTKLQNATVPQGASTYVLANRALIADLVRSRTTEVGSAHAKDRRKAWVRLINQGVLERLGSARSKVVCREDMADFILRLLQKGVFQQLTWLARRPERGYFRQCRFPLPHEKEKCSLDDLKVPSKATSVLWLGPSSHVPCDGQGSASTNISASPCLSGGEGDLPWDASSGPKPFARVTTAGAIANRQVPLYNLPALLGPERASELRKSLGPLSNEQFISIKAAQSPLQAQILLLRLQLYVVPLPEWDSECGGQLWPF